MRHAHATEATRPRRAILPASLASALALALAAAAPAAAEVSRFDGAWQTTVACAPSRDALGYSFRFESDVRGGVLHGARTSPDGAASLQLDGRIGADGAARLYAAGRTGSKEFVPGRDTPRGTEYGYNVDAHFDATTGTGTRQEGRPCTLQFVRQ